MNSLKSFALAALCLAAFVAAPLRLSAALIPVPAGSLTLCPAVGLAPTCAIVYRINADLTIDTLVDSTVPSTDGAEDTLSGVLNLTTARFTSLHLTGTGLSGEGIFEFDNDGQSPIIGTGPGASYFGLYDATSVGSQDAVNTFENIGPLGQSGDIVFPRGIVSGGAGWFVLEDQVNFLAPPPPTAASIPEGGMFALFGIGLVAIGILRWRTNFFRS